MEELFYEDDVKRAFAWLDHAQFGYTELAAIHKDFKHGKDNFKENLKNDRLPKIWYVKKPYQIINFVRRYWKEHTCCFGVNPRPELLRNRYGYARSALETDIQILTTYFFDLDCQSENSDEYFAEVELFIAKTEGFFDDIGVNPPTKAFSGRGFHLLFSPSPISIKENPDIKQRLHEFMKKFEAEFRKDLTELKIKIDSTLDIRRLAKIYGTKKADPKIRRISRFYGEERKDDSALKKYLLSLEVKEEHRNSQSIIEIDDLPQRFVKLMKQSQTIKNLWEGEGKREGDVSSTGYDFSLIVQCIKNGITDVNELASILANRPQGAYQQSGKNKAYISRTIGKAIMGC